MGEDRDISATSEGAPAPDEAMGAPADRARRGVLMLGAVAATSVVTIRPAMAQTAASVMNCRIPIPDKPNPPRWIDAKGKLVPPGTKDAFAPPQRGAMGQSVTGAEAQAMIGGRTPPGLNPQARDAYVRYIQGLRPGSAGFTCFQSLQMPRP